MTAPATETTTVVSETTTEAAPPPAAGPGQDTPPDAGTGAGGEGARPPGGVPRHRSDTVRVSNRSDVQPDDGRTEHSTERDGDTDDGDAEESKPADGRGRVPRGDGEESWLDELPPKQRKAVLDLRRENAHFRTENKQVRRQAEEATKAAEDKFSGAVEAFMRHLGLTPDTDEAEAVPPEERLAQVSQAYKERTVELAVYRAAGRHGGDPDALLDSRGFLASVLQFDPAAEDFDAQVEQAIAAAVVNNPKLRAVQVAEPAPSGGDFRGGSAARATAEDWSVDDFRASRNQSRDGAAP